MKILHLIGGGDVGGAKTHIISLASRLGKHCTVFLVSFRDGEFVDDARKAGIQVAVVENHSISKDFKQLLSIADEYKPDIVHCHGARANMMGVMLKTKLGLPMVSTIHSDYRLDYMHTLRKQLTFGMINRICLRKVDYFTCVAKRTARMMANRGFRAANIFTIYNGIDFSDVVRITDKREYFSRYGIEYHDGDVLCGIAARLTAVKDVPTLIKASAIAIKQCPNLKLIIGGDGEDMESLKALAKELGIEKSVYFLGWITDVHEFFGAIDINVICSLSETFPYSILEGIQERCATVTSDVGGMPELIDHGVNGYIFPPRDYEELGKCLISLASDENLRDEFAKKLFAKASANFSLDKMADTQYNIYKSIMARRRDHRRDGVLICGAYGKGNAGDDAILHAIVNEMRSIDPAMPVCVMSCHPKRTSADYGVDAIYTFNIFAMRRQMRRCAVYINGGGSLIQDVTSNRSLYFYLYTLRCARKLGAGVMMYGCGIGPVKNPRNLRMTRKVINNSVDVITLRENGSVEQLKSLGIDKPLYMLSADPAFTLTSAPDNQVDRLLYAAGIPPKGEYFCVCVRNWDGFDVKAQAIAAAADHAYEKYGLTCILLPIEVPGDLSAENAVEQYMKHKPYKLTKRYEADETIGIISRCRMVLSMRLHALIFASLAAVPIAGIVYDPKVAGFMDYIKQRLYVPLEKTDSAALCGFIDSMAVMSRDKLQDNADRLRILERINAESAKKLIEERTK